MNSPELDSQFLAITDGLELRVEGMQLYQDVTPQLDSLNDSLVKHLVMMAQIDPDHTINDEARHRHYGNALEKDFSHLDQISLGDTISTTGNGLFMMVDGNRRLSVDRLTNAVRLRGEIGEIYAVMAPVLESVLGADGTLDTSHVVMHTAPAFRLINPVIEEYDADSLVVDAVAIERLNVLLPLSYKALRILKQIDE